MIDKTLVSTVLEHGIDIPEKTAVILKNDVVSYGELRKRILNMAALLSARGVKAGDRVMMSAPSKSEYIAALLATQYLSAIAVPIDKTAKPENAENIFEATEAVLYLTDNIKGLSPEVPVMSLKELYAQAETHEDFSAGVPEYVFPEDGDIAELLFTSGTTGKPKGAMLSYKGINSIIEHTWNGIGMRRDDIVLNPLPLNHSFGMRVLRSILNGGATVVLQNGFSFAKEIENNINNHNCTAMVCVPASMEVIYRQMQDRLPGILGKLRYIELGAGSLSYDMKKRLLKEIPHTELHNTWGSTETGGALFLNVSKYPEKLTSIGRNLNDIDIKVLDPDGKEISATDVNSAGRMVLRGDMQMAGYWHREEETAKTLCDGWLYTNDLVYRDKDGFVYMLGRADDIINVGGEKVSPIEVENIAQEYKDVRECACIGVDDPDGIMGKVPILYVVKENQQFSEGDFAKFLAGRMERYKLPHRYYYIQELPRNQMQKLDRKALYRLYDEAGDMQLINPVIQNMMARRSVRKFTGQPIPAPVLDTILSTAYHAPSGHNMQTWRFTVLNNAKGIDKLKLTVQQVAKEKQIKNFYGFENPTVLVLISNDLRNDNGIQDSACAAENIMLAACSFGIGSVWLNHLKKICDEPSIRELLRSYQIPDNHNVWAMIALGYPQEEGKLLAKKKNVIHYVE